MLQLSKILITNSSVICLALLNQEVWPEKAVPYSNNVERKELLCDGCTLCSYDAPKLVYAKEQSV
eukprot:9907565-Ditylum_brightwellii.AAC.1